MCVTHVSPIMAMRRFRRMIQMRMKQTENTRGKKTCVWPVAFRPVFMLLSMASRLMFPISTCKMGATPRHTTQGPFTVFAMRRNKQR